MHGFAQSVDDRDRLLAGDSIMDSVQGMPPRTDLDEGSFSYLPSIVGVGRQSKEGNIAEIIGSRNRNNGHLSLTGKKPLLIANYRRAQHKGPGYGFVGNSRADLNGSGSIRMVDPFKARELIKE